MAENTTEEYDRNRYISPGEWDYDEIMTPFYNDAEGNSRGGDGTGFYEVYARPSPARTMEPPIL